MLKIFNTNKPFILFFLPLLAILIWLPGLLADEHSVAGPVMPLFYGVKGLSGVAPYLGKMLTYLAVIAAGLLLNRVVAKHNLLLKNTNLPATVYVILLGLTAQMVSMNPLIFANLFLIMALDRSLSVYNQTQVYELSFQVGILTSIAAHFYFPAALFLLLYFSSLIIIRTFNWRDWVIALLGFMIPFLYSWTYYFWFDRLAEYNNALAAFSGYFGQEGFTSVVLYQKAGFVLFAFLGLMKLLGQMNRETVRQKNLLTLILIYFGLGVISIFPGKAGWTDMFLICVVPMTIMLSVFFQSIRRNWMAESLFFLFLALILLTITNRFWIPM